VRGCQRTDGVGRDGASHSPCNLPAAKSDAALADTAKFISAQTPDQWVFSKFKGTDVIGLTTRKSAT
jgi:hypothetical protein